MTDIEKFIECIRACNSANAASAMAHDKYGLNAASIEDEKDWLEAMNICGWPFSVHAFGTSDFFSDQNEEN